MPEIQLINFIQSRIYSGIHKLWRFHIFKLLNGWDCSQSSIEIVLMNFWETGDEIRILWVTDSHELAFW